MIFQSTHPLRGATYVCLYDSKLLPISIHAPLAGCDYGQRDIWVILIDFNPRTPCGVRLIQFVNSVQLILFQSTHPLRGATQLFLQCCQSYKFQSTHPLRGATRALREELTRMEISIHAPLAGCDSVRSPGKRRSVHFNPRTPCGVRRRRAS